MLELLAKKYRVLYPVYVKSGNRWEKTELAYLKKLLKKMANLKLKPLTVLSFPMQDMLRQEFWSLSGKKVPGLKSKSGAVYLPGKNILLTAKAAVFCSLKNIPSVALGPLKTNPFPDATRSFFDLMEKALSRGLGFSFQIVTPFLTKTKDQVMRMGKKLPLYLTFSCLNPKARNGRGRSLHCAQCNKCRERMDAFCSTGIKDQTKYAN